MIHVALCDDEKSEIEKIKRHVMDYAAKYDYNIHCECFNSAEELLKSDCQYDLFFVDFQMPGLNGLELTKKLRQEKGVEAEVIFLTAYSSYIACDAYEVNAYRVLSKPINLNKLYEALNSIFESTFSAKPLKLKKDGNMMYIYQRDVSYIEASEKHCVLCVKNERIRFRILMKDLAEDLSPKMFFRVSKSFIVNFKYIESYNKNFVIMKNGFEIPIGREKVKEFNEAYDNYICKYMLV